MKRFIIVVMLTVGLTNNIQAGSLLEPILRVLVKGTIKIFSSDNSNENNQTKKTTKK